MRAVRFHRHGPPDVLRVEEVPDPSPGPGEILLEVKASSLNHLDLFVRRGMPGLTIPLPRIPGSDAAGIVRALGPGATVLRTGQRVCLNPGISCGHCEFCADGEGSLCTGYTLLGEHRDGTQAELVCVPERNAVVLPDAMSFETAAAAPLVYLTAWRMLVTKARLQPGMTVLILGAGAGVGVACVQIAKRCGALVYATASSPQKRQRLSGIGADEVFDPAEAEFDRQIRRRTGRRGVDVVIDYIGRDTWGASLRSLRRGGTLVTCGATTGYDPVEDLRQIFYRQLTVHGSTMGSGREFLDVWRCLRDGLFAPVIDAVLPFDQVAEAHRRMEGRGVFGKIVLTT
ncbi:MAG: zinc-binding dehydrogenase [Planctomycetes bacterium]|nr:zinc-binding dehydrogenase [Planctomycetota bacterium]